MVTKKTAASKSIAKAAPAKTTEVKTTVETKPAVAVKKEDAQNAVKKETPEKKPAAKKPAAKKPAAKKPAAKKPAAKKPAAKKPAAKAAAKKQQNVYIQFGGREVLAADVLESVKKAWVAMGNKIADMKDVQVYVKPEEFQAYFVINGDVSGSVDL